jgi:hypothetical protein
MGAVVKDKAYARGVISGVMAVQKVIREILDEPVFRAQLEEETGLETMTKLDQIIERTLARVEAEVGDQLV